MSVPKLRNVYISESDFWKHSTPDCFQVFYSNTLYTTFVLQILKMDREIQYIIVKDAKVVEQGLFPITNTKELKDFLQHRNIGTNLKYQFHMLSSGLSRTLCRSEWKQQAHVFPSTHSLPSSSSSSSLSSSSSSHSLSCHQICTLIMALFFVVLLGFVILPRHYQYRQDHYLQEQEQSMTLSSSSTPLHDVFINTSSPPSASLILPPNAKQYTHFLTFANQTEISMNISLHTNDSFMIHSNLSYPRQDSRMIVKSIVDSFKASLFQYLSSYNPFGTWDSALLENADPHS